jgi:phosphoglycolate phosphatase-like HAD superfamily hydrolase
MKNSLLIFDIDGTLTESETSHIDSFVSGMADLGIDVPLTNPEIYPHVTDSAISKFHFEKSRGVIPNEIDMQDIEQRVMAHYMDKPTANQVSGASNFLKFVTDNNIPYCFATGSFYSLAIEKLNKVNINYDVNLLATAKDGDSREEILYSGIARAKSRFNVADEPTIVSFGDGIWDLKTAKNMDLNFVGIGHKINYLKSKGAEHCFENFSSITCQQIVDLFR